MKYYAYVSASKVDMLLPQIPEGILDVLAVELEFDVKILRAKIHETPSPDDLYSRLAAVDRYIRKHLKVGSVDSPESWFAGTMELRWAEIAKSNVFYVGGVTSETCLGLGGQ